MAFQLIGIFCLVVATQVLLVSKAADVLSSITGPATHA